MMQNAGSDIVPSPHVKFQKWKCTSVIPGMWVGERQTPEPLSWPDYWKQVNFTVSENSFACSFVLFCFLIHDFSVQ